MAMIEVPRAELAKLVGLPADSDDATLDKAMAQAIARHEAQQAAAVRDSAEQRLQAEDRQIVAAAINAGKFGVGRRDFWLDALTRDRAANRGVIASLASLASVFSPTGNASADPGLEATHHAVMRRPGIASTSEAESSRTVAAAAAPQQWSWSPRVYDDLGIPISQVPPPARVRRGQPLEQWTQQERDDALQRRLGPAFWPGTKAPPAQDGWFQPGSNDHSEYVDGEGWRPNPSYQPRSD
jgi:hypothetical protein